MNLILINKMFVNIYKIVESYSNNYIPPPPIGGSLPNISKGAQGTSTIYDVQRVLELTL